jgi:hypothetical protein
MTSSVDIDAYFERIGYARKQILADAARAARRRSDRSRPAGAARQDARDAVDCVDRGYRVRAEMVGTFAALVLAMVGGFRRARLHRAATAARDRRTHGAGRHSHRCDVARAPCCRRRHGARGPVGAPGRDVPLRCRSARPADVRQPATRAQAPTWRSSHPVATFKRAVWGASSTRRRSSSRTSNCDASFGPVRTVCRGRRPGHTRWRLRTSLASQRCCCHRASGFRARSNVRSRVLLAIWVPAVETTNSATGWWMRPPLCADAG